MANSSPPLFKQGPSAFVRLLFFVLLSLFFLVVDVRYGALETLRSVISTAIYPFQKVALAPRDLLVSLGNNLRMHSALQQENTALKQQNLSLSLDANRTAFLQKENEALRNTLKLNRTLHVQSTPAMLSYVTSDPFSETVVIDKGVQDKIEAGSPVVSDSGLIGQVFRVFPFESEVRLITDQRSTVFVQTLRSGLRGVLSGTSQGDALSLNFIPLNADIKEGDILVTTGLDGVYPPGIPVAWVVALDRQSSTFAKILCLPVAPINSESHFLVLDYMHPSLPNPLKSRQQARKK